jgi:flagellar motility protein MotE (MotC chaperone)
MVRVLVFLVVSIMVFAGGLATSYFTVAKPAQEEPPVPFAESVPVRATDKPPKAAHESASGHVATIVREDPLSPEELFRYTALFRDQQQTLDQQRKKMEERQQRLALMEEDMRRARLELDGLRQETTDVLKRGEDLLQEIQRERSQFAQEQQQADQKRDASSQGDRPTDDSQRDNLKQISRWFGGMPPERAAEYLQELANDGKLASAAELLSHLEERDAAKILSAIPDAGLIVQLTEAFKKTTRPPKQKKR